MKELTKSTRGGVRSGAGRKEGSGYFGQKTHPIRVPEQWCQSFQELLDHIKLVRSNMDAQDQLAPVECQAIFVHRGSVSEQKTQEVHVFSTLGSEGAESKKEIGKEQKSVDFESFFRLKSQGVLLWQVPSAAYCEWGFLEGDWVMAQKTRTPKVFGLYHDSTGSLVIKKATDAEGQMCVGSVLRLLRLW